MKFLGGGIAMLAGLGVSAVLLNTILSQPDVTQFGLAFGNAKNGQVELHLVVNMTQTSTDERKVRVLADGSTATQSRDDYIAEHWVIKDIDGDPVLGPDGKNLKWRVTGRSKFIDDNKVPIAEWFLIAKLESGREYNLDFMPTRDEPIVFRHNFVAPSEDEKFWRVDFYETELEEGF